MKIKLRYILIGSLLCLIFGVYAYNQNAAVSKELAKELVAADNGDITVETTESDLASHVAGHMGSSISVFLAGSYSRAQVAASPSSDGQVYQAAQQACVSRTSAVNQAKCVQDYIAANSKAGSATVTTDVDKSKYTKAYSAPVWTPDLAGILLATSLLGFIWVGVMSLRRRPNF